jgi:hypothetical protein
MNETPANATCRFFRQVRGESKKKILKDGGKITQ